MVASANTPADKSIMLKSRDEIKIMTEANQIVAEVLVMLQDVVEPVGNHKHGVVRLHGQSNGGVDPGGIARLASAGGEEAGNDRAKSGAERRL